MADRAIDGVSKNPPGAIKAVVKYVDWLVLERDFLINPDHGSPIQWLREVLKWPEKRIYNGNTLRRVGGWGKKRVETQSRITESAIAEILAIQRQRIPELHKAKLNLVANIIADIGSWRGMNAADKGLCYQILKVELGEPTNPKDIKPPTAKDPVEALLEEYGLMENGVIIDDDPSDDAKLIGRPDSAEAAKPDSSAPAEIPPA